MVENLTIIAALASIVAATIYYLFSGFIKGNYRQIKWFRRIFLPHVTWALKKTDLDDDVYVESPYRESEHLLDITDADKDFAMPWFFFALKHTEEFLKVKGFRPEVLLASLKGRESDLDEVGNFILTAPEKRNKAHYSKMRELLMLLTSKYQLHVRLLHDDDNEKLLMLVHHELNPYNPLYAKKHIDGKEFSPEKGREMFKEKFGEEFDELPIEVKYRD